MGDDHVSDEGTFSSFFLPDENAIAKYKMPCNETISESS